MGEQQRVTWVKWLLRREVVVDAHAAACAEDELVQLLSFARTPQPRVAQKLLRSPPLGRLVLQTAREEVVELVRPRCFTFLGITRAQLRRRLSGDEEESTHGREIHQRWLSLCTLDGGDAQ